MWGPDQLESDDEAWEQRDSGRDWLKLAAAIGVLALLVVAVIVSFNLGRGSDDEPSAEPSQSTEKPKVPSGPVQIAGVSDLDPPPSGNGEENAELTPLSFDGNPGTSWQTMTYYGNPRFGLLKDGVGLVVDLGRPQEVSSAQVTLQGGPTGVEVYAAPEGSGPPTTVDGLSRVAGANGADGLTDLTFDKPASTQYLVVWLTSLPPAAGGYQGRVSEIAVRR